MSFEQIRPNMHSSPALSNVLGTNWSGKLFPLKHKRRRTKHVATAAVVVMSVFVGQFAHAGLGQYGQIGPITRAQLPNGINRLVSDRAIELAASGTFAQARKNWNRQHSTPGRDQNDARTAGVDFVSQVDYQRKFRAQADHLNDNPVHIAKVLEEKPQQHGDRRTRAFSHS